MSTERSPIRTTSSARTLAPGPPISTKLGWPRPVRVASSMPWTLPEGEVSGVLKSAWASSQITPVRAPALAPATPETVPMEMEGAPPRKIGKSPSETRSEEHTSELQSRQYLVCRLLLEKKQKMLRNKRR